MHLRSAGALVLAAVCVLASTTPARADEGRVAPNARAYPRGFASYDALVSFALRVSREQEDLDAELARVHAAGLSLADALEPVAPFAGGILRSEAEVKAQRLAEGAFRRQLEDLAAGERQLVAQGGHLDTGPDALWRLPVAGQLTQPFGPTDLAIEPSGEWRGLRYAHFHSGVDLAAPWGSPVVAPADGRVVFSGYMSDGALVVALAHDGGRVSLYAHLAGGAGWAPPVAVGAAVRAGDRIGSVGTTGMVTGPHLHWSVYEHGTLVDPLSLTP